MPKNTLILCDERDGQVAESIHAALKSRGSAANVLLCDASAETLGSEIRRALGEATSVVVVVREGGRGNRLLRAVEDEAPSGTTVLPLMADASPDAAVSARTAARIETLGDTIAGANGGGSGRSPNTNTKNTKWAFVAAVVGAIAIIAALVTLRLWPSAPDAPFSGPPVTLTGMISSVGWIVTFHLREEASVIEYKRPDDPYFIATGTEAAIPGVDSSQPRARISVTIPDLRGRVPFLVRYRDLRGAERGPYEAVFDTGAQAVAAVKTVLEAVPAWISFRLFNGRRLCYFTTLVTMKYAIETIRYGVDTNTPDRTVHFIPSDQPGVHSDDQLFIDLPEDASAVTVELVFRDGSTLGPKRFPVQY